MLTPNLVILTLVTLLCAWTICEERVISYHTLGLNLLVMLEVTLNPSLLKR